MPKIDIPIKRLMQIRIHDWIKFLIPNCNKDWIKEMDASKVPAKKESRLDKLILIDSPKERFILNIEPQGYLDYTMSARMLRYRSDIWEYTLAEGLGTPSIKQVVIYFYKHHDNKQYDLKDSWDKKTTLDFNYKAIKIWELKKSSVIEQKLEGLYSLLPLMDMETNETTEQVMELTMKTINTVVNSSLQADLLAVMSILVGEKFTSELVKKYVRRAMLMNSPIYNEWVAEERKEATEKATAIAKEAAIKAKEEAIKAIEKAKETTTLEISKKKLVELLEGRFDMLQLSIRKNIKELKEESLLDELFRKAINIPSLEDFEVLLSRVLKMQE